MARLVLALWVMVLASRETLTGKTAERNLDDVLITAEVKTKLVMDQTASRLPKITVDTIDGAVALNGNVESAAAKQQAAEVAGQVNGVIVVINNLQVQAAR